MSIRIERTVKTTIMGQEASEVVKQAVQEAAQSNDPKAPFMAFMNVYYAGVKRGLEIGTGVTMNMTANEGETVCQNN